MIEGHGDDLYRYNNIKINFSSNIYAGTDLSALEAYLCTRLDVVRSYPEPSAASLEQMIAHECGISPDEVLVTSGAVDAIYLIAQAYRYEGSCRIMQPTFREYEDACRVFGYQEREDGALCWLCNPNNPTGDVLAAEEVLALAAGLARLGGPWKGFRVAATAEQIGQRDARRLHGRYTVTRDDVTAGATFPDAVTTSYFGIDIHGLDKKPAKPVDQCCAMTWEGTRCTRKPDEGYRYCTQHRTQPISKKPAAPKK